MELDLSWCERNCEDFWHLYTVLKENTQLCHLNLSWNSLFAKPEKNEETGELQIPQD